jgi:hypothetical protein
MCGAAFERIESYASNLKFCDALLPSSPTLLGMARALEVRYLGALTAAALAVLMLAHVLLPRGPGFVVSGLALLLALGAGIPFLFQGATLISAALQGRRRVQFQVAVSIAVPLCITLLLAHRADAVPVETLRAMLTPWFFVVLGIIAWLFWFAGDHLDQHHPFKGFVITALVFGVLCFMWSAGMTTESDSDGESWSYLDPEKARDAKATGRYVWQFLIYLTTAYIALFLKLRRGPSKAEAFHKFNEALTPEVVQAIVSKMGGYIADRKASPGRKADLPFPAVVIETAFYKAMRDSSDPDYLELLKATYIGLDDFMLSDEDCDVLTRYDALIKAHKEMDVRTVAERLLEPDMIRAVEIRRGLREAMERRIERMDRLLKKAE